MDLTFKLGGKLTKMFSDLFSDGKTVLALHKRAAIWGILAGVSHKTSGAFILLDSCDGVLRSSIKLSRKRFSMIRYKRQRCVGFYNFDSLETARCPNFALPEAGDIRCRQCNRVSEYVAAFETRSPTQLPKQMIEYLSKSHTVYFAWFGTDVLKVGISQTARLMTRLTDQGAICAAAVCTVADGFQARRIEIMLSKTLNLPQIITSKTKFSHLADISEFENGVKQINQLANRVPAFENITYQFSPIDLRPYYSLYGSFGNLSKVHGRRPLYIDGSLIACIGSNLIVQSQGQTEAVDLRNFQSYLVSIVTS